jgi:hypothetical protein
MAVFLGLDVHRAQITFDALDVDTGEVQTGRVRPANRDTFARFLARFDGGELVAAVEAMTGWRFVVEELQGVGAEVHLAEPTSFQQQRRESLKLGGRVSGEERGFTWLVRLTLLLV